MNVNDLVEAFGLPRYYAAKLPAGSSVVATIELDGNVRIRVHAPGQAPSTEPTTIMINELGHVVGLKPDSTPMPVDLRKEAKEGLQAWDVQTAIRQKRRPGRPRKAI